MIPARPAELSGSAVVSATDIYLANSEPAIFVERHDLQRGQSGRVEVQRRDRDAGRAADGRLRRSVPGSAWGQYSRHHDRRARRLPGRIGGNRRRHARSQSRRRLDLFLTNQNYVEHGVARRHLLHLPRRQRLDQRRQCRRVDGPPFRSQPDARRPTRLATAPSRSSPGDGVHHCLSRPDPGGGRHRYELRLFQLERRRQSGPRAARDRSLRGYRHHEFDQLPAARHWRIRQPVGHRRPSREARRRSSTAPSIFPTIPSPIPAVRARATAAASTSSPTRSRSRARQRSPTIATASAPAASARRDDDHDEQHDRLRGRARELMPHGLPCGGPLGTCTTAVASA